MIWIFLIYLLLFISFRSFVFICIYFINWEYRKNIIAINKRQREIRYSKIFQTFSKKSEKFRTQVINMFSFFIKKQNFPFLQKPEMYGYIVNHKHLYFLYFVRYRLLIKSREYETKTIYKRNFHQRTTVRCIVSRYQLDFNQKQMKLFIIVSLYYIKKYFNNVPDITSIFFVGIKLLNCMNKKKNNERQLNGEEIKICIKRLV